jgi:cell division septation protein DedD
MAENRRGKENRFYFSRGQMVLLGAAFTVASLIIFVLGIFVGKGIESRKLLKKEEPLVKIPIKPGAQESSAPTPPPVKEEITYNDSLPRAAVAAPSAEKTKPTKSAEKIAKVEIKETANAAKIDPPPVKASDKKVEKSVPPEDTAKKAEASDAADQKDHGKTWRAQVNAFPDERSAKQIVDRLKNKGYNAYVTEVQNRGKTWYRVSVGKYNSRDEADKMVELLRSKENYPKAFAATR